MASGYVSPSTEIVMLKNCVLQKSDNDETDTLLFSSVSVQRTYFGNAGNFSARVVYGNNTYQNVGKGVLRLGATMHEALGYNYMYFTNANANFENKTYYCFVDDIRYINNNCVEISYSLDYLQTFMFDYREKTCLVERMTTDDDTIGKYIQPEPITYSTNQFCYGRYEIKSYSDYSMGYPMLCQPEFIYYTVSTRDESLTGIFLNIDNVPGYKAICITLNVESYTNLFGVQSLDNGGKSNSKVSVSNFSLLVGMRIGSYIKEEAGLYIATTVAPSGYPAVATEYTFSTLNANVKYISQLFSGDWWTVEGFYGTDRYARFVDNISAAIVFPSDFLGSFVPKYVGKVQDIAVQQTYWKRFVKRDSLFNIDEDATYIPENNKLLTYPFKYGMYGTLSGERMEYRYELLPTSITGYRDDYDYGDNEKEGLRFSVLSCILPSPMALCVARNYYSNNLGYYYGMNQGSAQYDARSYEFGISLNEFPTIPTTIDGYNKYLAETSSGYNMGLLKSLLSLVSSGSDVKSVVNIDNVGAKAYQTAMVEVSAGLSYLERQTNAVLNPNYAIGVFSAPNLIMSAGYSGFYFWDYGVDIESAKVIDGYFTRYGYKLNANITPSRNNNSKRKNFTFIKTVECNISILHTNMTQDDEKAIEAIYNRGVRFWYGMKNGVRMYKDYSDGNPIVS